jgi:hypothetical protein
MVAVGRATGPMTGDGVAIQTCKTCGNMRQVRVATAGNHSRVFKTFTARDWSDLLGGKVPFNLKDSELAGWIEHALASGGVYGAGLAALRAEQEQRRRNRPYELTQAQDPITEIEEPDFVEMVLTNPLTRGMFLNIKGIPDSALYRTNVPHSEVPGGDKGDVDVLLWNPDRPHEAAAIEAKRIKVKAATFETGKPNKLNALKKARLQANDLEKLGFAYVFLFVIVVVDSRSLLEGREISYDGPTPEVNNKIDEAISTHTRTLHPRVGVLEHRFIQSMDTPPHLGGSRSDVDQRHAPTAVVQPAALTAWLAGLDGKAT